ncbi:hypothetical protein H0H92_013182 [Tricholoma furcatifolium]|nr:hypothetical protein H0H92_013182 [Tricholoma furcatifolium]
MSHPQCPPFACSSLAKAMASSRETHSTLERALDGDHPPFSRDTSVLVNVEYGVDDLEEHGDVLETLAQLLDPRWQGLS